MSEYWSKQQDLVRKHYKFVAREEPPTYREPPAWYGPVRMVRPSLRIARRAALNWRDGQFGSLSDLSERAEKGEKNSGEFLMRIFSRPDPIATNIVRFLNMADLYSLKQVCRSFREALMGDHSEQSEQSDGEVRSRVNNDHSGWRWMLRKIVFGDEMKGAAAAFDALRKSQTIQTGEERSFFWNSYSIQKALDSFNMEDTLVRVNVDNTGINAAGIGFLFCTFINLTHISARYCQGLKLDELHEVLTRYAGLGPEFVEQLSKISIDYWNSHEIYRVVYMMLVNQAFISDTTQVANKIRHISRYIQSNVFLCIRNHESDGIYQQEIDKYQANNGPNAVLNTYYPCEIRTVQCSLCMRQYERRFCLRCWPTQICSYCKEYHCPQCEPQSYVDLDLYASGIGISAGSLSNLATSRQCCSEIRPYFELEHHFHPECWREARPLTSCKGCDKFVCWTIPSLCCTHCRKRQCPNSSGYDTKMCQVCKLDYAYDGDIWATPASL